MAAGIVLAVASIGSVAHAGGWAFRVQGGASIPVGDFADEEKGYAQTGWLGSASVGYVVNDMWSFGVDGGLLQNSHGAEGETVDFGGGLTGTLDEAKYKMWQFGGHARLMFPMSGSSFHPYAVLGLGAYNVKQEVTVSSGGSSTEGEFEFDTRFGGRLGVGGDWMFSPTVGFGIETDYNLISMDEADTGGTSSLQFVGIRAGIKFTVPTAGP